MLFMMMMKRLRYTKDHVLTNWSRRWCFRIVDLELSMTQIQICERHKEWPKVVPIGTSTRRTKMAFLFLSLVPRPNRGTKNNEKNGNPFLKASKTQKWRTIFDIQKPLQKCHVCFCFWSSRANRQIKNQSCRIKPTGFWQELIWGICASISMPWNEEGGGYCDGKSTVVEAVIHGRPGILSGKMSKEEALHEIADATGTSKLNPTDADFTAVRKGCFIQGNSSHHGLWSWDRR